MVFAAIAKETMMMQFASIQAESVSGI